MVDQSCPVGDGQECTGYTKSLKLKIYFYKLHHLKYRFDSHSLNNKDPRR